VGLNIDILPLKVDDINNILLWNDNTPASFLEQWAGRGYSYPITREQVNNKMRDKKSKVYKIMLNSNMLNSSMLNSNAMADVTLDNRSKMIGTVELSSHNMPSKSCMICRFLIAPAYRSRGYGTLALMVLAWKAFTEWGYKQLKLRVFAYNEPAVRCYIKAGFKLTKVIAWDGDTEVYEMSRKAPRIN
jgi:RimJ/RimL family protein N-acetyltransferase